MSQRGRQKRLDLKSLNERLDFVLKLFQIVLAVALLLLGFFVVWQSYVSRTLVIEPFQVPGDFSVKSIDGTGVAARLRERLRMRISDTEQWSQRAAETITGDWGDRDRIDVPQSDSLAASIVNGLRDYFGKQVRIVGAIYRVRVPYPKTDSPLRPGVALNIRIGDEELAYYARHLDPNQDLDSVIDELVDKASFDILKATQPYTYAIARSEHECDPLPSISDRRRCMRQDVGFLEEAARKSFSADRSWLFSKASERLVALGDYSRAEIDARLAVASGPRNPISFWDLAIVEGTLGHDEAALAALNQAILLFDRCSQCGMTESAWEIIPPQAKAFRADLLGDYGGSLESRTLFLMADCSAAIDPLSTVDKRNLRDARVMQVASDYASRHDPVAARACLANANARLQSAGLGHNHWNSDSQSLNYGALPLFNALADEDKWDQAVMELETAGRLYAKDRGHDAFYQRMLLPLLAYAYARKGDYKHADYLLNQTPLSNIHGRPQYIVTSTEQPNCYMCIEIRGHVTTLEGKNDGMDIYWYKRAIADAPSIPVAYLDWGLALLSRGNTEAAIGKFALAHQKGPHFADPLEMWGEALVKENRSDKALAKFEEANKYAPNWGHLHLEWGKALFYAGQKDGAKQQLNIAQKLDLSGPDKTALMDWHRSHH